MPQKRTFIYALIAMFIGVPACSCEAINPTKDDGVDRAIYAYRSATELALMQGTTKLARLPSEFHNNTQALHFTNNHRHLFDVTDSHGIAVIDMQNRQTQLVDCGGCTTVQPYSHDSVVWWAENPSRLSIVDLSESTPAPRTLREISLPPGGPDEKTRLLSVHDSEAIIARTTRQLSAPEALFAINSESGTVKPLGTTMANSPIRSASMNANGTLFAYAAYDRDNPVCGDGIVGVIDLGSGKTTTTTPQEPQNQIRTSVARIWWSDGALNAVYARWDCSTSALTQINPPSVWRYLGHEWTEVQPGPVSQMLMLDNGDRVTIIPDTSLNDFKGTLYLDNPAGNQRISDNVYALAVPSTASSNED